MTTQFDMIVSNKKRTFKFIDDITIDRFNTDYVVTNMDGETDIDINIDTTNIENGHHWEIFAFADPTDIESTINLYTIGPSDQTITFTMIISSQETTSTYTNNLIINQNGSKILISNHIASSLYGTIVVVKVNDNIEVRISMFLGIFIP